MYVRRCVQAVQTVPPPPSLLPHCLTDVPPLHACRLLTPHCVACMQAADTALHRRLPQRLVASWRNGYGAVRSKTLAAPRKLNVLLRPCLSGVPLSLASPPGTVPAATPVPDPTGAATAAASVSGGAGGDGGPGVGMDVDGSQGGGSQRGPAAAAAAAAATTAALEDVVEAITTSVVSQVPPRDSLLLYCRLRSADRLRVRPGLFFGTG